MILGIIQARMNSTRLPGKVLKDICGKTMLERVIRRVRIADFLDEVVVATTINQEDNAIVDLCDSIGCKYFRGDEKDVLKRYLDAALEYKARVIVRITADCPLIDASLIDKVVEVLGFRNDYASNSYGRTYPRGLDVEAFTLKALQIADKADSRYREHVTPYIWMHPKDFKIAYIRDEVDRSYMRWTVDTEADLQFVRKVYGFFHSDIFSWEHVLEILRGHPEIQRINHNVPQKELVTT